MYTQNIVASLQKHRVAGRTYWRIVESRRVRGKPRAVPLLHLGSADDLLNRLLQAAQGELRIQSFQHGDVAALKAAADRLGVISIIDRHVPASARGLLAHPMPLEMSSSRALSAHNRKRSAALPVHIVRSSMIARTQAATGSASTMLSMAALRFAA